MKIIKNAIPALVFLSCSQTPENKNTDNGSNSRMSEKPDFTTIQFASGKDTTCGMPLSAGVSDTAIIDGKVYGFCAKDCKDAFLQQAKR